MKNYTQPALSIIILNASDKLLSASNQSTDLFVGDLDNWFGGIEQ